MSDDKYQLVGNYLKLPQYKIDRFSDYQVVIGFSGFGNVGYLAVTHIVETVELETIAFWGSSSWYYKGRLESLLTIYEHKSSKTIFVLPRIPIHVTSIPQRYWDELAKEILSWRCKEYIIIGGLKEDTRHNGSTDWAAYVPSSKWIELYGTKRTLHEQLAMIGPLSSFLTLGTTLELPILGLLAYCTLEDDPSAALIAVSEIEKLCKLKIPNKNKLIAFNYSFIPNIPLPIQYDQPITNVNYPDNDNDDDDDDLPGYDIDELV